MATVNSSEKVSLSTFPLDRRDALTILYMQNQDLSDKTPEEIADMYDEAWDRISKEFNAIRESKKEERRKTKRNLSFYD